MTFSASNLFRIPDLRKKLLITMGLLFVYRIGFHIPIPGVDISALADLAKRSMNNSLLGMMSMLTGSQLGSAVIFSLGVMPYISSSIIFSLLVKVVPSLEALSKEGAAGQKKINQYTRYATVPICVVQAYFILYGVLNNPKLVPGGITLGYSLVAITAFTAGSIFIMWLGEQITEYGVGNGVSLIIMAGIIARMPSYILNYWGSQGLSQDEKIKTLLLFALAWAVTVYVIVYITKAQRRIPIQQAKLTRGRKVYGGQRHFLPIKVNQAGVMPIIFASALTVIPNMLGKVLAKVDPRFIWLSDAFGQSRGWWYWFFYCGMIVFFSFFWNSLMFQPKEIANNLKEYGSFIPGIRPGHRTAEFLEGVMNRLTLAGSVFLAAIAFLPSLVTDSLNVPYAIALFMGGTSVLIVVEVALDFIEKLNAMLVMRNYDGFFKGETGGAGWGRRRS